jgi:hypothetical protein
LSPLFLQSLSLQNPNISNLLSVSLKGNIFNRVLNFGSILRYQSNFLPLVVKSLLCPQTKKQFAKRKQKVFEEDPIKKDGNCKSRRS